MIEAPTLETCSPRTRALIGLLLEHDAELATLEIGEIAIHVGAGSATMNIERKHAARPLPGVDRRRLAQ